MDFAACLEMDPEAFFPERGQSINEAVVACFECAVREECHHFQARTKSNHGVWAGKLQKRGDEKE